MPGHPRKIRAPTKCLWHAHRAQCRAKLELLGHLELWHSHDNFGYGPQFTQPLLQVWARERLFQGRKTARIFGQKNNHRQFLALVRDFQDLKSPSVEIAESTFAVHQWRWRRLCWR